MQNRTDVKQNQPVTDGNQNQTVTDGNGYQLVDQYKGQDFLDETWVRVIACCPCARTVSARS